MIDAARAIPIPLDREVIHILPQEFIIDDQDGIREPLGMSGVRLESRVYRNWSGYQRSKHREVCSALRINRCGYRS